MNVILTTTGVVCVVAAVILGWATYRNSRELRRFQDERRRIAAMDELVAREQTRPNGHVNSVSEIDRRR